MDVSHRQFMIRGIEYIRCSKCKLCKVRSAFKANRANSLGLSYHCRQCQGVKWRSRRHRLPRSVAGLLEEMSRIAAS